MPWPCRGPSLAQAILFAGLAGSCASHSFQDSRICKSQARSNERGAAMLQATSSMSRLHTFVIEQLPVTRSHLFGARGVAHRKEKHSHNLHHKKKYSHNLGSFHQEALPHATERENQKVSNRELDGAQAAGREEGRVIVPWVPWPRSMQANMTIIQGLGGKQGKTNATGVDSLDAKLPAQDMDGGGSNETLQPAPTDRSQHNGTQQSKQIPLGMRAGSSNQTAWSEQLALSNNSSNRTSWHDSFMSLGEVLIGIARSPSLPGDLPDLRLGGSGSHDRVVLSLCVILFAGTLCGLMAAAHAWAYEEPL